MTALDEALQQAREQAKVAEDAAYRRTRLYTTTGGKLALNPGALEGILPQPHGGTGTDKYIAGHVVQDEGTALPQEANLNFVGGGVIATDSLATSATVVTIPGKHTIADEGTALTTQRQTLNFIGAGVLATDNPATSATDITISTPPHVVTHETSAGGDYLDPGVYQIPASTAHRADSLAGLLDQLYTTDTLANHGYGLGGYGTEPYGSPDTKLDNPMTTAGDLIVGTTGGAPSRLGIGTAGQVLTVSGGAPAWTAAAGGGHTIQDEGVALPSRANLNFLGAGVTAADNAAANSTDVTVPSGITTVQDEGVALTQRPVLNVIGEHATAADDAANSRTNLTVAVPDVTTTVHGLMIATDKSKLDGVAAGAQVNVLESVTGTVPINVSTISAKSQAVSISPATSAAAGSMSAADKSKLDSWLPASFSPYRCRLTHSLNQSVPNAQALSLTFDTEIMDTDGLHNTTNPERITIQHAGVYAYGGSIMWDTSSAGSYRTLAINMTRGGTVTTIAYFRQGPSGDPAFVAAAMREFQVGDYLVLSCYQDSGAPLNVRASVEISPILWVAYLGPL